MSEGGAVGVTMAVAEVTWVQGVQGGDGKASQATG